MYTSSKFKRDENVTYSTMTEKKGKRSSSCQVEPIRLRNLNLAHRDTNQADKDQDLCLKVDSETADLEDILRKPERMATRNWQSRSTSLGYHNLKELGDINNDFIPPSPSLERTIAFSLTPSRALENSKMWDAFKSDLSSISNTQDRGFDCQPFFHPYKYENRWERDDYVSIVNRMLGDEIVNRTPIFQKELEFLELHSVVKKIDYIIYYSLGIDRLGYFELREERNSFYQQYPTSYTLPLDFGDSCSLSSTTKTEEDNSESEVGNLIDGELSNTSSDAYV